MSMTRSEREMRDWCRIELKNPKLKDDDIQEWSTSKDAVLKSLLPGKEVFVEVPALGVYCAVLKTADKRPAKEETDARN